MTNVRIGIMSDMHLEHGAFNGPVGSGDIALLAGDICVAAHLISEHPKLLAAGIRDNVHAYVDRVAANYDRTFMVMGNHEHWAGVFNFNANVLRRNLPGITLLDNQHEDTHGLVVYGGTMWTDFNRNDTQVKLGAMRFMADYEQTWCYDSMQSPPERLLHPEDVYEDHLQFLHGFKQARNHARDTNKKLVVVSHHAPSPRSVSHYFKKHGGVMNHYYHSDLHDLLEPNVPLWAHGHTHDPFRYNVNGTEVICNPRGYVGHSERANYEPVMVDLEV